MDYPSHRETDVVLRDGRTVHLRPARPQDRIGIEDYLIGLSTESRRLRFWGLSLDVGEAARSAARHLVRPIIVASITTALGFALLAVVQVIPVQEMALFGAAGELICLVTTMLDPQAYPLAGFPDLYHDRWQLETAIGDVETRLRGGPDVVLRSKSPDMIRQEVYGLLCVYQALRALMSAGAEHAQLDPDRISFTRTMQAAARHLSEDAAFSP